MATNARRRPFGPVILCGFAAATLLMTMATTAGVTAHYTNQFAVRVAGADGAHDRADRVARKHGFINRGQVSVPDGSRLSTYCDRVFARYCCC